MGLARPFPCSGLRVLATNPRGRDPGAADEAREFLDRCGRSGKIELSSCQIGMVGLHDGPNVPRLATEQGCEEKVIQCIG